MQAKTLFFRGLLNNNFDINIKGLLGETPIYTAIKHDQHSALKLLIAFNADLNIVDETGFTPLMIAVVCNNINAINDLISNNVNVNQVTENGTAFTLAIRKDNVNIMSMLYNSGADVNLKVFDGKSAFDIAKNENKIDAIKFLNNCKR